MNIGIVGHALSVHIIPKGGSADATNIFVNERTIDPQKYLDLVVPTMSESEILHALIEATSEVIVHAVAGTLYTE